MALLLPRIRAGFYTGASRRLLALRPASIAKPRASWWFRGGATPWARAKERDAHCPVDSPGGTSVPEQQINRRYRNAPTVYCNWA